MARRHRIDYPGAWHHVMNRGARRAPIFADTDDCQTFLDGVGEAAASEQIEVHAYALMPNHFHLLVRSPQGTLSRAMRRLGAGHTARMNARHGWDGPVFRGRFTSRLVTRDEHLRWLLAYLHLNPVRSGLALGPLEAVWTSHRSYLGVDPPPAWLQLDTLLEQLGGRRGVAAFIRDVHLKREQLPEAMEIGRWFGTPSHPGQQLDVTGSSLGEPKAVEAVLRRVVQLTGVARHGLMVRARGRGANPARRLAAWALAADTSLTHAEVGRVLDMTPTQVTNVVSRVRRSTSEPLASWRRAWRQGRSPKVICDGV